MVQRIFARFPGDDRLVVKPEISMFEDGIKYTRHPNGGGYVAQTARVDPTVFVGFFARVHENATISGNAVITGCSQIAGCANISGNSFIGGNSYVGGRASVSGNARIEGNAFVAEEAMVCGCAIVVDNSRVLGREVVTDFKAPTSSPPSDNQKTPQNSIANVFGCQIKN